MKVGDRIRVINESSSLQGYEGTIRGLMYEHGLSIQLDGKTITLYFNREEVEVVNV